MARVKPARQAETIKLQDTTLSYAVLNQTMLYESVLHEARLPHARLHNASWIGYIRRRRKK
jgi:uncharacterized protein YjbI with pentapeptide repeats